MLFLSILLRIQILHVSNFSNKDNTDVFVHTLFYVTPKSCNLLVLLSSKTDLSVMHCRGNHFQNQILLFVYYCALSCIV